jgi:hypothetical protein
MRTSLKQVEAILSTYYELGDVELDYERFQKMKAKRTNVTTSSEAQGRKKQ